MELFEEVVQDLNQSLKVETPAQETVPETTEPVVTETVNTEPVVTETVKTETPAPPSQAVGMEIFKELGYESPDQLKSSLNDLKTKAEEYEKKLPYYSELEKEFENIVKLADPMNLFKSEEEYNHFLMTQKLGEGKDFGVTQKIVRNDLDKMSDLDVLSLQYQYDSPRFAGQDLECKRTILKQLGVDIEDPEFDIKNPKLEVDKDIQLSRMAQQSREFFNRAKSDVKKPERPDFRKSIQEQVQAKEAAEKANKERFNQRARTWEEKVKGLTDSAYKFEMTEKNDKNEDVVDFAFTMEDEFKKEMPEMIMHHVLSNGLEPTQENVDAAIDLARRIYISDNWQKLLKAHTNQAVTKLREQLDKERYNGTDFNTRTAPPSRDEDLARKIEEGITKMTGIKI
jgi:hypothetical protein